MLKKEDVPEVFINKLVMLTKIIGTDTDQWLVVKRHLINNLPIEYRNLLSLRHPTTLKQQVNDYDRFAIKLWEDLTGVKLILPPEKIHDPNWKPSGPSGWRLKEINDARRKNKA
jgi:hypothetical protein